MEPRRSLAVVTGVPGQGQGVGALSAGFRRGVIAAGEPPLRAALESVLDICMTHT